MKKKSTSKLAFLSLRVLPTLVAVAFIAFALALSNSVGETLSCAPSATAQWPSSDPNILLNTDFYWTVPLTPHPVLLLRGCNATTATPRPCSLWTPSPTPYHMVVQEIRENQDCHLFAFSGDLLYKFDQDDGHVTIKGIKDSGWSQLPGGPRIAMEGWSNGGIVSYLAAVGADTSLRGIQPHYATGDLLNYGLFNGGVQHKEIPYPVDVQWGLWRVADFDHDGNQDYVLYNPGTRQTAVWYLNSDLTVRTTAYGPTINPGWQLQAVDDFDHDGTPDYVLDAPGAPATAVWYLNNNLTIRTGVFGPNITSGWLLVTVGDFDGDGTPDYVLYNPSTRQTAVWYLNSNVTFRAGVYGPTITSGWLLVAVGDFDGDGNLDYVLYNPTTRQTAVWYLNGNVTFRAGVYGPIINPGWQLPAVDDFDHDGTPDYVLYAPSGQATAVWYLNSNLTIRTGVFGPTQSSFQISWKDYVGLGIWDKYLITDSDASGANVAGLHVGGWFDVFGQGILDTFSRMQTAVGNGMYTKQKVVIGPWIHGGEGGVVVGQIPLPNFVPSNPSLSDYDTAWKKGVFQGDWSDWNDTNRFPAVKVYLTNADPPGSEWQTYTTWPPPGVKFHYFFTSTNGIGVLTPGVTPPPTGTPLAFTSDPSSPCPTLGGTNNLSSCGVPTSPTPTPTVPCGPWDQRPIEGRSDVVVFTSDPLTQAGATVGRIHADVWIQTDLRDVDVVVRMTDVYPPDRTHQNERSMLMAEGIQRAKYRNGGACPQPLVRNQQTRVRVDLGSTAWVVKAGHKVRVIVSASAGPNQAGNPPFVGGYSVNPQNGDEYLTENSSNAVTGSIKVLTGGTFASELVLSVPGGQTPQPDERPPKPTPCPN